MKLDKRKVKGLWVERMYQTPTGGGPGNRDPEATLSDFPERQ